MKIYISGQMTGLPFDRVQTRFATAERILTEQGYEVVNPLNNGISINAPWELHVAADIVLLMGCEAIYLLADWNLSRGATLEKNIAELTGKQLIYEKTPVFVAIKQAISEVMGISFHDIVNDGGRGRNHVYARMIYAHFCKEQGASITEIAKEIKRNHSTVIYYLRKFPEDRKFNPGFREIVSRVETTLISI
jgi:hypothetical protein